MKTQNKDLVKDQTATCDNAVLNKSFASLQRVP
jgi:hypothetical protein